jgi:alkylation response protein AidB-like acyl-CoA dehydrogenase
MDLNFTPEEEAFRAEVRSFLRDKLPARIANKVKRNLRLTKADMEEWHAILNARDWLATIWPEDYGGPGWTIAERYIFDVETALAGAPRIIPFGLNMLGPVLIKYGNDAQKKRWLPRILDGSDWWCQGYSEPGAGSDLANLKCAAVRDGDEYVVNGQKTWTTLGQFADMIFCLVRTDPQAKKRQEGISFLLIDMKTPGVEVRPIILLDGEHEVNEVFFTDVRVSAENLVGEENQGWTIAKYLLTHERTNIAGVGGSMAAFEHLLHVARTQRKNGHPLAEDPLFAARLARLEIDLENMKTTNLRVLAAAAAGQAPGAESSMLKIRGTEIRQEITSLTRRALGPYAQPFISEALDEGWNGEPVGPDFAAPVSADYFNNRKLSIFGGSNEVQREIITKAILEL